MLLRKKFLETQDRNNYSDEYDRVKAMLNSFMTTRLLASGKPMKLMEVRGKDRGPLGRSAVLLSKFKGARKSMAPDANRNKYIFII